MADTAHKLPEFDRPPVVETVMSVQFDPLIAMTPAHAGVFWERIRERFPNTESRAALEPVVETFEDPRKLGSRIRFETAPQTKPFRCWFINAAGTELIQVQQDRFIRNWRKTGEGDIYPRYERSIKPAFIEELDGFREWLRHEKLGELRMNQCELSYINHIEAGDEERPEASRVFPFLNRTHLDLLWRDGSTMGLEDAVMTMRFPIQNDGQTRGRLMVEIQPGIRNRDQKPLWIVTLTARGQIGDGLEFFDLGREMIVRRFAQLTSREMHELWLRRI